MHQWGCVDDDERERERCDEKKVEKTKGQVNVEEEGSG